MRGEGSPGGRRVLSTKDAAEYLGVVSPRTLEKWRISSQKRGPRFVKMEGIIGYRVKDLDEYLDDCLKEPGDDFE